jgi:hypothetical protein
MWAGAPYGVRIGLPFGLFRSTDKSVWSEPQKLLPHFWIGATFVRIEGRLDLEARLDPETGKSREGNSGVAQPAAPFVVLQTENHKYAVHTRNRSRASRHGRGRCRSSKPNGRCCGGQLSANFSPASDASSLHPPALWSPGLALYWLYLCRVRRKRPFTSKPSAAR